jgi:hypothetical protein
LVAGHEMRCDRLPHQPPPRGDGCFVVEASREWTRRLEHVARAADGGRVAGRTVSGVASVLGLKVVSPQPVPLSVEYVGRLDCIG